MRTLVTLTLVAVSMLAAQPAFAKRYNEPPFLASAQQAKINRTMAQIKVLEGADEQFDMRNQDCNQAGMGQDDRSGPIAAEDGRLRIGGEAEPRRAGEPPGREEIIVAR
jgi:hypothetical protein